MNLLRRRSSAGLASTIGWLALWAGLSTSAVALPPPDEGDDAVRSTVSRTLDRGRAVLDELQRALADRQSSMAQLEQRIEADREQELSLAARLEAAADGRLDAEPLYRELVEVLRSARDSLRQALERWHTPPEVPHFDPGIDLQRLAEAGHDEAVEEIVLLTRHTAELREEVLALGRQLRWRSLQHRGRRVVELNELRIRAIAQLDPPTRDELLGISRRGLSQLGREVEQLGLAARFFWASRLHTLRTSPTLMDDPVGVGVATYGLLKVLALAALALWIRSRWRSWLETFRRAAFRARRGVGWKRRIDALLSVVETAAPWALVLLLVWALDGVLGPAAGWPEVSVLLTLAALYAAYRLSIDLAVAAISGLARRYRLRLPEDRHLLLVSSVRRVARAAFAVIALLTLSARFLGRGYLYHLVEQVAWLVVLASLLVELVRWRRIMADAFLGVQSTGRMAALVRTTRDRWTGVLVTPASFLWLAGRAVVAVARDFALGFEHTGRLLAFLFRRRVERQAERQGYAEADPDELPADLLEAFTLDAVQRGPLVVPHFPGLEDFNQRLSSWRDGGWGGSFLLSGERGAGKTTWLAQVRRDDIEILRLSLDRRVAGPDELVRTLADGLGVDPGGGSVADLARTVAEAPRPRLVIIDLTQHLFLAAVGGFTTFAAFAELVNRTRRRVFWLCGMSAYAWRHLRAVRPDAAVFRGHTHLAGWNEDNIRRLIRQRVEASGVRVSYADLVVDAMEGTSARARLIQSEEGYTRLLWDYADGNPRAALHYFVRSLEPEGEGRVRVRLFRAADPAQLEEGGTTGLFVLAAIVIHESVSLEDLARVSRYPESNCRIHVDRLLDLGAVVETDGLYRVSTTWHRTAIRLLRRRNLIPD